VRGTATKIGWNVQTRRQMDFFGASVLGTKQAFADHGYSHPNLDLRLLVLSYRLHPSHEVRALLKAFMEARQSSYQPSLRLFDRRSESASTDR
jgi:hypothetical protein